MWTISGSRNATANAINARVGAKRCCVILAGFLSKVLKVCGASAHFWKKHNAADAIEASEEPVHKRAPWRAHPR